MRKMLASYISKRMTILNMIQKYHQNQYHIYQYQIDMYVKKWGELANMKTKFQTSLHAKMSFICHAAYFKSKKRNSYFCYMYLKHITYPIWIAWYVYQRPRPATCRTRKYLIILLQRISIGYQTDTIGTRHTRLFCIRLQNQWNCQNKVE